MLSCECLRIVVVGHGLSVQTSPVLPWGTFLCPIQQPYTVHLPLPSPTPYLLPFPDQHTLTCPFPSAAAVLIYGYVIYQKRLTMIATRYPGSFDQLVGPLLICVALFIAILANFIFRLVEARKAQPGVNPLSFTNAWQVAGKESTWLN